MGSCIRHLVRSPGTLTQIGCFGFWESGLHHQLPVFYKILQAILQAQRQAEADEINRALERRRKEFDQQNLPAP